MTIRWINAIIQYNLIIKINKVNDNLILFNNYQTYTDRCTNSRKQHIRAMPTTTIATCSLPWRRTKTNSKD